MQFTVGQCAAPAGNFIVHKVREKCVIRLHAKFFEDGLKVMLRLDFHFCCPDDAFFIQTDSATFYPGICPLLYLPDVLILCTHLPTYNEQGQWYRILLNIVTFLISNEVINQVIGKFLNVTFYFCNALRTKSIVKQ